MKYPIYEVVEATEFSIAQIIRTDENGTISSIPCDLANADYKQYLASLNETDKL
jgi:hypothetical protein